jgi:tyrosinase
MSFIRPPLLLLAVVATLLSHVAIANTSYDYGIDRSTILKRQDSSFYAITGVHTSADPDISTAIRHEIRSLEQDNITWTLYILGLDMLQYTNQTEMLSWYQIAGTSSVLPTKPFG